MQDISQVSDKTPENPPEKPDDLPLLHPQQVAELLHISTRGLFNLRKKGLIRAVMVGGLVRYRRSDVAAAISSDTLPIEPT